MNRDGLVLAAISFFATDGKTGRLSEACESVSLKVAEAIFLPRSRGQEKRRPQGREEKGFYCYGGLQGARALASRRAEVREGRRRCILRIIFLDRATADCFRLPRNGAKNVCMVDKGRQGSQEIQAILFPAFRV